MNTAPMVLRGRYTPTAKASTGILKNDAIVPMPTPMKISAHGRF